MKDSKMTFPSILSAIKKTLVKYMHMAPIAQNEIWDHNWNPGEIHFALTWILMAQSDPNFVHTMTAQMSWHAHDCDLIRSYFVWKNNMFVCF